MFPFENFTASVALARMASLIRLKQERISSLLICAMNPRDGCRASARRQRQSEAYMIPMMIPPLINFILKRDYKKYCRQAKRKMKKVCGKKFFLPPPPPTPPGGGAGGGWG